MLLGEWQSCRVIIFVLFCRMHAVVVVVLHVRGSWAYLGYGSTKVESFCDREQYFFANELECIFNIYSEMSIFLYPFEFLRVMCNFIIRCYYMFSERGKKKQQTDLQKCGFSNHQKILVPVFMVKTVFLTAATRKRVTMVDVVATVLCSFAKHPPHQ